MAVRWSGKRYHNFIQSIFKNIKGCDLPFCVYYFHLKYFNSINRVCSKHKRDSYTKSGRLSGEYTGYSKRKDKRFDPQTKRKINPYNR